MEEILIETEKQRRWWFATHPEFSSSRSVRRRRSHDKEDRESDKVSPDAVDAYVDESLKYQSDERIIDLLKSIKFWFGTEFASKTPAEKHALLWGDEEDPWDDDESEDESSDITEVQPTRHPAADRDTYDRYEDVIDRIEQYGKAQEYGFRQNWDLFWWRARNQGWTEDQARRVWQQIELERGVYAPLHDPGVQLGIGLTSGIGAWVTLRSAMSKWAAAEAAGNSKLAALWRGVVNYLRGRGTYIEGKVQATAEETGKVRATMKRSRHPEAARHVEEAQAAGQPSELTIDRAGAQRRGREALKDHTTKPGKDRDEYPPKMFQEGGRDASVRPISPADNRGAGASVGQQLRKYPDGTKVKIEVVD